MSAKDRLQNNFTKFKDIFNVLLVAFLGLTGWLFLNIGQASLSLWIVALISDIVLIFVVGAIHFYLEKINDKIGELP